MNKEQQIIEWFENNKIEYSIFSDRFVDKNIFFQWRKFSFFIDILNNYNDYFHNGDFVLKDKMFREIILFCYSHYKKDYFDKLRDLLIKKNHDYGNTFDKSINKFGWIYLAIILETKKNRLHSLLKSKEEPNYESIEDTLLDIAGYCVLALIYIDNNKE